MCDGSWKGRDEVTNSNQYNAGERNSGTRIEKILGEILKQPTPEARQRCLNEACGEDAKLRAEVESLLTAHAKAGDFLEQPEKPPGETRRADSDLEIERTGMMIGRYKLLEQIGEGGFGVVYMAEQVEPIQRKVALKIVKAGMDTREVIARFEAEQQALALMDHPNIAHVLDAGATQAGRPYFVMELVKGIPITDFCDQKKLSPNERLDLFMKVCQAVQHAHQKGIIHRDIKPTNVLVTLHDGTPVPKVIDFGVAKALGQRLTEKTLFTGYTHMLGTPAYMSPEQAELSGLDVDTRSDIYSLGVLLYELLTGGTPLDRDTLAKAALDEVRRMIRESEPPKPSTRLQTLGDKLTEVATCRHTEPPRLVHFLRGDLDWIVMKCLEKDRRRRYETPSGLVMDVQRHLDNEPVVARPPSQLYRLRKLIRRNKLVFAAGSAVAGALITGLVVSTWQFLEKSRAYQWVREAEQEQSRLRQHAERLLYASDMNLAFQAIHRGDLGEAYRRVLEHWPQAHQPDLRGWEWRYLWQQCQGEQRLILGKHTGGAGAVAFSADGRFLASGSRFGDGQVTVWDLSSAEPAICVTNGGDILALAFSPEGDQLAVGSDRGVRLWNTTTWRPKDVIVINDSVAAEALCFSPDGRHLVGANSDGFGVCQLDATPPVFDRIGSGTGWWSIGQHACAISSDGRFFVHARNGFAAVLVRDLDTRGHRWRWTSKTRSVRTLALSPDDKWLAIALHEGRVRVHGFHGPEGLGGDPTESHTLDTTEVFAMAFSPDGKLLAVGGVNGRIELWNTDTWGKRQTLKGHHLWITDIAFSPDTNAVVLASSSADGTVRLWSTSPKERDDLKVWPDNTVTLSVDPTWKTALYVWNTTYALKDIQTGERFAKHRLPYPRWRINAAGPGPGCNVGPDAKLLAFALTDRTVRLWDRSANNGKGRQRWSIPTQARVGRVHFSEDGSLLFGSVRQGGRMWVWDVSTGREIASATNTWDRYLYLPQFTPDYRQLAIPYNQEGEVCLWDFAGSGEILLFNGRHPGCENVALSSDGAKLAVVNRDGKVKLWDVETREPIAEIEGRGLPLRAGAFSHDGKRLITLGEDELRVWDIETRQQVSNLRGDPDNPGGVFLTFEDADTLLVRSHKGIRRLHAPSFAEIEAAEQRQKSE